ncbi:MAG: flagellar hook-associated protein FlgL [Acidimicrobiia bacterium]
MDNFRITQQTIGQQTFANLQLSLNKLQALQQELSSGRQLNKPSDDPQGTVAALSMRGDIARANQYTRNLDDGMNWLGLADSTLQKAVDAAQSARTALIQGQSGAIDANGRAALATQIDQIREGLLALANTQYLGRPIFGGTAAGTTAYDAAGVYQGNTGTVTRNVAPGTTLDVNVTGPTAFGSDTTGLFATLAQISADLRNNSTSGLTTDLGSLDANLSQLTNQLAEVGSRYNRLQVTKQRNDDSITRMTNSLSEVEDADLPKTIVDLQTQEVAYQAALAATSKVITPSLVDFLR